MLPFIQNLDFYSLIIFFIVLTILIFVHEFGHFFVAKKLGIGVEEFGFGLPPRIWGKKIGETVYSINWLPLGGFVRLTGEDVDESAREKITDKKELRRYFWARNKKERVAVLLAGVGMNFLLAVVILTYIFNRVGVLVPTENPTGHVYILGVLEKSPAEVSGLQSEDLIISIDDVAITSSEQLMQLSKEKGGQPIKLVIERNGEQLGISLTPRKDPGKNEGPIGISINDHSKFTKYSLLEAPFQGVKESLRITYLIFRELSKFIIKIVTFQKPDIEVGGPVRIYDTVKAAIKIGFKAVAYLTGLLSLNLALFNALPIPALDGGRLFFVVFEKWLSRRIKPRVEAAVHQVGLGILLLLAILITINDLRNRNQVFVPTETSQREQNGK